MRFFLLLLLIPNLLWAVPLELSPALQSPLQQLNNGQVLEALDTLSELENTHLNSREYLFLKAMVKWKMMWLSTFTPKDAQEVLDLLDEVENICRPLLDEDTDARFFYAASIGLRAQIAATQGDWWKTAKLGKKMKGEALLIIEKDQNYYPAYYLAGSYNYFADALPGYLKVLRAFAFLPGGDRKQGLQQLVLSYEKGGITESEAGQTLAIIYTYYEHNFAESNRICEKILSRYPLSYDTALYKGVSLYYLKEWKEAGNWLENLRSQILSYSSKHETSGQIVAVYQPMEREVRYWIARTLIQQQRYSEAREILLTLANPPVHQPYWLLRAVYLSLAQIDYLNEEPGRAEGYIFRVLQWDDVKDAHEKAKKLKKKKGKVGDFDIDFL
jgi:hypothetical protein